MEERQLHANFRIIPQIHATNIGTVLSFSNSRCSNFCLGFFVRAGVYVWHVKVCMCVCIFLDYFEFISTVLFACRLFFHFVIALHAMQPLNLHMRSCRRCFAYKQSL